MSAISEARYRLDKFENKKIKLTRKQLIDLLLILYKDNLTVIKLYNKYKDK